MKPLLQPDPQANEYLAECGHLPVDWQSGLSHYTKLETLEKILTNKGVSLKAVRIDQLWNEKDIAPNDEHEMKDAMQLVKMILPRGHELHKRGIHSPVPPTDDLVRSLVEEFIKEYEPIDPIVSTQTPYIICFGKMGDTSKNVIDPNQREKKGDEQDMDSEWDENTLYEYFGRRKKNEKPADVMQGEIKIIFDPSLICNADLVKYKFLGSKDISIHIKDIKGFDPEKLSKDSERIEMMEIVYAEPSSPTDNSDYEKKLGEALQQAEKNLKSLPIEVNTETDFRIDAACYAKRNHYKIEREVRFLFRRNSPYILGVKSDSKDSNIEPGETLKFSFKDSDQDERNILFLFPKKAIKMILVEPALREEGKTAKETIESVFPNIFKDGYENVEVYFHDEKI